MANILLFVCMLSALNIATSEVVKFTDCTDGKGLGELQQLEISPCPVQPCQLKRGTKVAVKATFVPHENVTDAESSVHGKVMGFWVPFPLPNPHACKDSGLTCPLVAGTKYVYESELDIKSEYPAISVVVKWEMQDPNAKDLFCFEISAKIVS